jgi:prepilin-type N-terminal cleavage/methylation domain-containing protein
MTLSRRSAFTFVELCIAVSIISVLAAILFPVFGRAREKARQAMCASNLGQIGLALRLYAQDHYGQFSPTDNDLEPLCPRYLPERGVLRCPSVLGPGREEYVYRGGFAVDDDPLTPVAADPDPLAHNEGFSTLFQDGHAKWRKSDQGAYDPFRSLVSAGGRKMPPPTGGAKAQGMGEE